MKFWDIWVQCNACVAMDNVNHIRGGGTGGARGARAPPIFWGQRNKIHLEFCFFSWLISVMHPLKSAPRTAPDLI